MSGPRLSLRPSCSRLPTGLLAIVIFALVLGATVVGALIGKRVSHMSETLSEPLGVLQGALLGVVGLIMAFGLSLAVSRYETRRTAIVDEANAIGTTYLRAQTLPEPEREQSMELLDLLHRERTDAVGARPRKRRGGRGRRPRGCDPERPLGAGGRRLARRACRQRAAPLRRDAERDDRQRGLARRRAQQPRPVGGADLRVARGDAGARACSPPTWRSSAAASSRCRWHRCSSPSCSSSPPTSTGRRAGLITVPDIALQNQLEDMQQPPAATGPDDPRRTDLSDPRRRPPAIIGA